MQTAFAEFRKMNLATGRVAVLRPGNRGTDVLTASVSASETIRPVRKSVAADTATSPFLFLLKKNGWERLGGTIQNVKSDMRISDGTPERFMWSPRRCVRAAPRGAGR